MSLVVYRTFHTLSEHPEGGSSVHSDHSRFGVTYPTVAELKPLTDDQLMVQLQAGVNDALAVLFERYHRMVFSIALKIVRDRGEAEDVMQNVFLEIFRSVAQFDPARGTTKVWFLQYAYHRAINRKQYLNARSFYSQQDIEEIEPFLDASSSTFGKYAPGELNRLLQEGLAILGEPQRKVIELASYEGLSMKEIADSTGDSLSNVRHHYYRGLQKLRSFITQPSNHGQGIEQQ
jgi:RNA polymerase sigma-70 factor (ECF subfamily)